MILKRCNNGLGKHEHFYLLISTFQEDGVLFVMVSSLFFAKFNKHIKNIGTC